MPGPSTPAPVARGGAFFVGDRGLYFGGSKFCPTFRASGPLAYDMMNLYTLAGAEVVVGPRPY